MEGRESRVLVVGDVHGCVDELRDLLRAADFAPGDRLVLVGDLVAKGPDSRAVLRLARELDAEAVRGNHDERVLRFRREGGGPVQLEALSPEHRRVVESLEEEDWRWLEARPLFLRLPEHGALVIHGGIVPGVPLEEQDPNLLMNLRSFTADGRPTRRIEGGTPWAARWPGPELVLFGHDAVRGLQQHPFAVGLDTGCVYGGALTGMLLPERRLLSVSARRAWSPVKRAH